MSCIRSGSRNLKKPTPEKSLEKYSGGVIYECKNMAQKQKKKPEDTHVCLSRVISHRARKDGN